MINKKSRRAVIGFLPIEIVADILSRLPVESVLQCKYVCKAWKILIDDSVFVHMHNDRLQQLNDAVSVLLWVRSLGGEPVLGLGEYNDQVMSFKMHNEFKPIDNSHLFKKFFHMDTVGSCNGLVCLSPNVGYTLEDKHIYVCNPFIGEYLNIPRLRYPRQFRYKYMASGFGYHPSTKEYKIIRVVHFDDRRALEMVHVYTLGSGKWRSKGECGHSLFRLINSMGVLLDGALHWLNKGMELILFDLAVEEFRMLPSPPLLPYPHKRLYELGVLGGCLCVTQKVRTCRSSNIWVMMNKEYSWIKKFSIPWPGTSFSDCKPIALLKSGRILLQSSFMHIFSYHPKGRSLAILKDFNDTEGCEIIPYMKSFVSLKDLGEEDAKWCRDNQ